MTGSTISPHHPRVHRRVDQRARRERAHASGIRPLVIVEYPLVILGRADRERARPVAHGEERNLRSGQALFDHEAVAGGAEFPGAHHADDRGFGRREIRGDDDAFSGSQTVRLQNDRPSERTVANQGQRLVGRVTRLETGSRDAMPRHERFGKCLTGLQAGRG